MTRTLIAAAVALALSPGCGPSDTTVTTVEADAERQTPEPDPQSEPEARPETEPEPTSTFDAATVSEIDARILTVYDDHWTACGVLHSVGTIVVEVLGVAEPRPRMVLFVSCPADGGQYKLLEVGKQVTVKLHARKQSWPKPPDPFPADLPVRYVKTIGPWLGPTPDPITHPCVVTAAQFDRELAEGDRSCKSASDCDCFPGGVTKKAGCGGVTGAGSAKTLHALASEFRGDECSLVQHCAAQACTPKCVDGQCAG